MGRQPVAITINGHNEKKRILGLSLQRNASILLKLNEK